jgi:intermediate filament protein if
MRIVKGETATRTSFQRSAKGNVSIHVSLNVSIFIHKTENQRPTQTRICINKHTYVHQNLLQETNPEGKFIVLENTHRSKEEPIGEWKLKRKIDGKKEIVYTMPKDFVLRPGKNVKVRKYFDSSLPFSKVLLAKKISKDPGEVILL